MNPAHVYLEPKTPRDIDDALFALHWALTGALVELVGDDVNLLGSATLWGEAVLDQIGEWT